ncbi:MAG: DUF3990 domain-containing protein [Parasporobacterium sp.]|nr:DUF3990 domain-containing protein [Parasporobacterium sp.]
MKVYHGSERIIQVPIFGMGKAYNDYGLGFYCTESEEMAREWAVEKERDGYANIYELNSSELCTLNLNSDEFCILHWLAVLLENRYFDTTSLIAAEAKEYLLDQYHVNYKEYDVIRGYRADDSYFSFAQDFLNNTISIRQLNHAMQLGNLGEQVVLKSKKAFENIKYQGFLLAERKIWYPKKKERDEKAREDYFDSRKNKRKKEDLFISQIIDGRITGDDLRI